MEFRFDHIGFLTPDAHRLGRCANNWVDDWQRNPAVLPRRGDTALRMNRAGSVA